MAKEWTRKEFEILLQNPGLSNDELASLLPDRSEGAVSWVRGGISKWQQGTKTDILSRMMLNRLGKP